MGQLRVIGHRGARGLAPENTLAGLKKALEVGADEIEFDVRVTSDGIPVLNHSDRLKAKRHLKISKNRFKTLKASKQNLARLSEVLELVNGQISLYVEVKRGVATEPIVKLLTNYTGAFRLASKHQKTLIKLHSGLPEIPTIVIEAWFGIRATHRANQLGTKTLSMNKRNLWFGFIKAISKNYELYAYTLNDPEKAKRWAKYGLAGVITDRPDLFKS